MKKIGICLALAALLLLCACGAGGGRAPAPETLPADTGEPVPAPTPEPTPAPTPEPTPEPTPALLLFPDGSEHREDEESVDLSSLDREGVRDAIALLETMPALRRVSLGEAGEEERLGFEDVHAMQEALPGVDFDYRFTLWGKDFSTLDEAMELDHIKMDDEGAAVRAALPCMTKCRLLNMDFCGVSSEAMAQIRDENPQMEVIWRIWFGNDCSIRTDAERILASNLNHHLTDANTVDLKYATKIKYLDIGHNTALTDLSFLSYMPDLEVAVIAISPWRDLSPLAGCKKLEYLEVSEFFLNYGEVMDLAPLGELTNLKHLNTCKMFHVKNWEALENLTGLERLWIGAYNDIPPEGIEELRAALPDTEINTTERTGSLGSWRENPDGTPHPRYTLLAEQFDYANYPYSCSTYTNDPNYFVYR